jgi:hypothetical protein
LAGNDAIDHHVIDAGNLVGLFRGQALAIPFLFAGIKGEMKRYSLSSPSLLISKSDRILLVDARQVIEIAVDLKGISLIGEETLPTPRRR